eukprot:7536945-Pyramimonas_sp.AAC.1
MQHASDWNTVFRRGKYLGRGCETIRCNSARLVEVHPVISVHRPNRPVHAIIPLAGCGTTICCCQACVQDGIAEPVAVSYNRRVTK